MRCWAGFSRWYSSLSPSIGLAEWAVQPFWPAAYGNNGEINRIDSLLVRCAFPLHLLRRGATDGQIRLLLIVRRALHFKCVALLPLLRSTFGRAAERSNSGARSKALLSSQHKGPHSGIACRPTRPRLTFRSDYSHAAPFKMYKVSFRVFKSAPI